MAFANQLLEAARAYRNFAGGLNVAGNPEVGIQNTRLLGGKSIKQHFILLMAGRRLSAPNFSRLANEIEKTMFAWLITGTPGKEYERRIVEAAHRLNHIGDADFVAFVEGYLVKERTSLAADFHRVLVQLDARRLRAFRLRYLLAKLTQHVDFEAYGESESRNRLADYTAGGNDIEHILPDRGLPSAMEEFGAGADSQDNIQRLGNLMLIELSINRAIQNQPYSVKKLSYLQSKFLLAKCQADTAGQQVGVADRITRTVQSLECWPEWNANSVRVRQQFLARLAHRVWDVRSEVGA